VWGSRLGNWRVLSASALAGVLLAVGAWVVLAMLMAKPPATTDQALADKPANESDGDPKLSFGAADRSTPSEAATALTADSPSPRSNGATLNAAKLNAVPSDRAASNGAASGEAVANGPVANQRDASRNDKIPSPNAAPPAASSTAASPASVPAPLSTGPAVESAAARVAAKPTPDVRPSAASASATADPAQAEPKHSDAASSDPAAAGGVDTVARAVIETHLEDRLPSVEFSQATLREFVDFISEFSTLTIVIDREALAKQGKGPQTTIAVRLKNVTVSAALKAGLGRQGLVAVVRGDKLVVTTADAGR
jgi:hypothetical protein